MKRPSKPKAVLIDMAGVLHVGSHAIPGAVEALEALRSAGFRLRFLTNTTRTPILTIVAQMRGMGFVLSRDEVFTAPQAARDIIEQRGLRPHFLVHPNIEAEMGPNSDDPNAVVLGDAGPTFTYARLNQAFRLLMDGLPLIAMAKNRYFKEEDGLSLDMGAFVAGLEYSSGVTAEIVGKPSAAYFHAALSQMSVAPRETVMIGDDWSDDIGGAQNVGIAGILVRTGKYRPGDETREECRPAATVDDFAQAAALIIDGC